MCALCAHSYMIPLPLSWSVRQQPDLLEWTFSSAASVSGFSLSAAFASTSQRGIARRQVSPRTERDGDTSAGTLRAVSTHSTSSTPPADEHSASGEYSSLRPPWVSLASLGSGVTRTILDLNSRDDR